MPIVIVSGCEKAGKTTFCNVLAAHAKSQGANVEYRHFSGSRPVTREDAFVVMADCPPTTLHIWDRSWACGVVYKRLGFGQRPEALLEEGEDFGDWVRAGHGLTLMLLGPGPTRLRALRTPDDLPVDPGTERLAFKEYGRQFGWEVIENRHDEKQLGQLVAETYRRATSLRLTRIGD